MRVFSFLILIGMTMPQPALAQAEQGRRIVPAGQVIAEDYGVAGEVVEIAGIIEGDAYLVGGQIFVNGVIEGDLLAMGGSIHISGEVQQNIRVLGGQVVVSGKVGRNATVAGMNVTFTDAAQVEGGVVVGASNVFVSSPIGKEARIAGRNATLSSAVGGDVEVAAETVRVTSGANIGGDFTYWSNREASFADGISVVGQIHRKAPEQLLGGVGRGFSSVQSFAKPFLGAVSFFSTLILGFVLMYFFPGFTERTLGNLRTRRWRSLTNGVTALLVIPLLFGLLIITIVGIPLGFLLLLLSSLILYISRIFVMVLLGQLILERFARANRKFFAFAIGLVLYSLVVLLPVVGWPISFLTALFGLGAAVQTAKDNIKSHP